MLTQSRWTIMINSGQHRGYLAPVCSTRNREQSLLNTHTNYTYGWKEGGKGGKGKGVEKKREMDDKRREEKRETHTDSPRISGRVRRGWGGGENRTGRGPFGRDGRER